MSDDVSVNYLYNETHTTVGALMDVLRDQPKQAWVMLHLTDDPVLTYADLSAASSTSVMSEYGLTDIVLLHPSFLGSPFDTEEG